jgi:hypothetical protein
MASAVAGTPWNRRYDNPASGSLLLSTSPSRSAPFTFLVPAHRGRLLDAIGWALIAASTNAARSRARLAVSQ